MSEQRQHAVPAVNHSIMYLPQGVLEYAIANSNPRQLATIACVCTEWRDEVIKATTRLTASISSDAGAASLAAWIQHHGENVRQLELATIGLYSRHCDPSTRLKLFHALHPAAGSTAAIEAVGGACSSEEGEEAEDNEEQEQALAGEVAHAAAGTSETGIKGAAGHAASAPTAAHQQTKPLQLTHLAANMRLTAADCTAIASLPAPHLVSLQLVGSRTKRLGYGVTSLVQLQQLTSLKVQQLGIGDDATALLAQHLTNLLQLSLSGNNIGPVGAAGIAKHLTQLQQLDLSVNRIKDAGLCSICSSLHRLQCLSLSGNIKLGAAALQQLHQLQQLSSLQIGTNTVCNQGLAAVAAALPQLLELDASSNKISKADALTGLVCLTSLILSRNPLQISCSKVLAGLTDLQELVLFDSLSAKAVAPLASLAPSLTALTLGTDPSLNPEGTTNLPLAKTRACSTLFGGLAETGKLRVLAVPCSGMGDAQAKLLSRFGSSLVALNLSYNNVSNEGLKFLKELPQLQRLEVRSMRPELTDEAARLLANCCSSKLQLLDIAYNDLSSEGVRHLGSSRLPQLQHLNLRNNVQVEKEAVIAAAAQLSGLTYLNLLELSDVSARAGARGPRGAAGAAAAGRSHADVWAALPNLQELVAGSYNDGGSAFRSGRVMISCGG